MTSKELLYVEDALSHECIMKTCSKKTSTMLSDMALASYLKEAEEKHTELFNKFFSLL